jgi:hypothetical protein
MKVLFRRRTGHKCFLPMELFDRECAGEAQVFSPTKAVAIRQRAKEIAAEVLGF